MATAATAIWRFRTGGNAANGAGYDGTSYPGGTDYSTQDAAQLTLSDVACANNTTVTSATGGFTAAMVGNAIRIAGGGSSTGYYWITARASTNSVTVDRTPGTVTAGSGRVGGACTGDPANLGPHVVPGNTVYLRATAGNAASYPATSLDYAIASFFTPTAGDATSGHVRWVGENGTPTIGTPGLAFYNAVFQSLEGLYLVATGASNGALGMLAITQCRVVNCVVNLNSQAALVGMVCGSTAVEGCEVYGGSTSPTASSGCCGIQAASYNTVVRGCSIHHCRDHGVLLGSDGATVAGNRIWRNAGNGIEDTSTASQFYSVIEGNTIDGNAGHGVSVSGVASVTTAEVVNNGITNHAGSGKYGISVADGTAAQNDRRKRFADYNNLYGNTGGGNYLNVTAGAHDLAADPGYASASAGDFTPGNAAVRAGFPATRWIGAVEGSSGGGGGFRRVAMGGGF